MKKKVAILCGGRSAEHAVSLLSARNILNAIDKSKYECHLIGIDRAGVWHSIRTSDVIEGDTPKLVRDAGGSFEMSLAGTHFSPAPSEGNFDVVFPVLHGQFGEDGSVQGLLRTLDVPYVGPDVLGSAMGMDKDVMKRILRDAGIPVGRFLSFTRAERRAIDHDRIRAELGDVLFVKPANQGSSIGISRAESRAEFDAAVELAFKYDRKILVEEAIVGRELECGVLGNQNPSASVVGEVASNKDRHRFYSYEAKYFDEKGAAIEIPARIPPETASLVQRMALRTFHALCCEGMARVDFFLKEDGEVLVNEINTIPGFTRSSMYPKLWEASGIGYSELIERLLELAIERHKLQSDILTTE